MAYVSSSTEENDFVIINKEDIQLEQLGISNKMPEFYNAHIPDDKPITSMSVVEDSLACPPNFKVVSKTHDQDVDADLAKDGFFKRVCRYLCFSKTEGPFGYVIENILILNDKESKPKGYTIVDQTSDTGQKAFRKKQLCYKVVSHQTAAQFVTDIIVLSRTKMAPEGFTLVGEMNGLLVCYKQLANPAAPRRNSVNSNLPYGVLPGGASNSNNSRLYPGLHESGHHLSRAAPLPPMGGDYGSGKFPYASQQNNKSYLSDTYCLTQSSLFGVPFNINKNYIHTNSIEEHVPTVKKKTYQEIMDDYDYNFSLEYDVLRKPTA